MWNVAKNDKREISRRGDLNPILGPCPDSQIFYWSFPSPSPIRKNSRIPFLFGPGIRPGSSGAGEMISLISAKNVVGL